MQQFLDESLENYAEWKNPILKDYILYLYNILEMTQL